LHWRAVLSTKLDSACVTSKGGLKLLTQRKAVDLGLHGITVNGHTLVVDGGMTATL
jgi:NAD(P)-dependent dehydrogenase (short-subunit alcohol dehydrogenase family)